LNGIVIDRHLPGFAVVTCLCKTFVMAGPDATRH